MVLKLDERLQFVQISRRVPLYGSVSNNYVMWQVVKLNNKRQRVLCTPQSNPVQPPPYAMDQLQIVREPQLSNWVVDSAWNVAAKIGFEASHCFMYVYTMIYKLCGRDYCSQWARSLWNIRASEANLIKHAQNAVGGQLVDACRLHNWGSFEIQNLPYLSKPYVTIWSLCSIQRKIMT